MFQQAPYTRKGIREIVSQPSIALGDFITKHHNYSASNVWTSKAMKEERLNTQDRSVRNAFQPERSLAKAAAFSLPACFKPIMEAIWAHSSKAAI